MQRHRFWNFCLIAVAYSGWACWGRADCFSDMLTAIDGLDQNLKNSFEPGFLAELASASKCIAEQLSTFNACNFNTSVDPFYYIQTCLQGSKLQEMVEKAVQKVPVYNVSRGIPQKVSNDRCDCDLVPESLSCYFQPPPPTYSPAPPISILGK